MQDAVCGQGVRFIESGRCWTDHLAWRSAASAFPLSLVPERVPDSLQLGQTSARPFARLICDILRPPFGFEERILSVLEVGVLRYPLFLYRWSTSGTVATKIYQRPALLPSFVLGFLSSTKN